MARATVASILFNAMVASALTGRAGWAKYQLTSQSGLIAWLVSAQNLRVYDFADFAVRHHCCGINRRASECCNAQTRLYSPDMVRPLERYL